MRLHWAPWARQALLATVTVGAVILSPVAPVRASDPVVTPAPTPLVEALRERVDRLRYAQASDARGARVVLTDLVARFYETRRFEPAWQGPGRLDELVAGLETVIDDGLDPTDYHVETLRSYRLDLRIGATMTAAERADLELVATDAMMLAAYHLYLGKVDPHRLSPQWNFSERPVEIERGLARLSERLAAGEVRELFDAVRPQHAWYQRGRERLREYRRLEADGGWPRVDDGPTLRPGVIDARVTTLRRRLLATHDLMDAAVPVAPETYDAMLESAVKRFQERHGLRGRGSRDRQPRRRAPGLRPRRGARLRVAAVR